MSLEHTFKVSKMQITKGENSLRKVGKWGSDHSLGTVEKEARKD